VAMRPWLVVTCRSCTCAVRSRQLRATVSRGSCVLARLLRLRVSNVQFCLPFTIVQVAISTINHYHFILHPSLANITSRLLLYHQSRLTPASMTRNKKRGKTAPRTAKDATMVPTDRPTSPQLTLSATSEEDARIRVKRSYAISQMLPTIENDPAGANEPPTKVQVNGLY